MWGHCSAARGGEQRRSRGASAGEGDTERAGGAGAPQALATGKALAEGARPRPAASKLCLGRRGPQVRSRGGGVARAGRGLAGAWPGRPRGPRPCAQVPRRVGGGGRSGRRAAGAVRSARAAAGAACPPTSPWCPWTRGPTAARTRRPSRPRRRAPPRAASPTARAGVSAAAPARRTKAEPGCAGLGAPPAGRGLEEGCGSAPPVASPPSAPSGPQPASSCGPLTPPRPPPAAESPPSLVAGRRIRAVPPGLGAPRRRSPPTPHAGLGSTLFPHSGWGSGEAWEVGDAPG